jgi:NADH-quinone oxidoreductase subunit N
MAWILVAAGLGFKVAAVPFHLWAPDTYEGAPAPSAAFIASVSKVASFALLVTLAVNWWVRPSSSGALIGSTQDSLHTSQTWPALGMILMVVSAASMIWGNLAALAQTSVRRLLAYSAVAHAGYMLLAIAVHPVERANESAAAIHAAGDGSIQHAMQSVLYYVLTYGITTIGAFGLVAVVERATGSDRMDAFLGLRKRNPLLAGVLLVLFLSLAGIPPLIGFWAKFNLFAAVLREDSAAGPLALVCLAIAMSAVSLYYYLQVLKRAYVMPAVDDSPLQVHPVVLLALLAIAAAVVVLGVFPSLLGGWIASLA